uniref:C-type lectin domain-containing protein n=1 Tax=Nothobranchius furzeri TaxID=105023 RepID=A0A8C6M691_NOTFU
FSQGFILSSCLVRQYFLIDQSLNWTEAQTYCRQKHVDLSTTENATELTRLVNTLSFAGYTSDVWIGLFNEVTWKWSDGSGAEYVHWEIFKNEPNFASAQQFCNSTHLSPPSFSTTGTQLEPKFTYVNNSMSWSKAQKFCRDKFVDLATIRDENDSMIVQNLGPFADHPWIGLYRDPIFNWSDGSSFLFSNWDNVYNVIGLMKVICGVTSLSTSGTWKFSSCGRKLPFMCYSLTGEYLLYFFIDQSLNWTEAQTYCRQKHVDLATTENATELTRLVNTLSFAGYTSDVWIGLFNEVTWKWSDGSGAEYVHWDTSDYEPDFYAAFQFCVASGINGRWRDEYCGNKYSFICYNGNAISHVSLTF